MNASAYQFEPELVAEINRVIPIYERALASPDELICGIKNGEEIQRINKIPCKNTKLVIPDELECLKNSYKLIKANPVETKLGRLAVMYFRDNKDYPCFTEDYMFRDNRFGTELGEARVQFYKTLKNHRMVR